MVCNVHMDAAAPVTITTDTLRCNNGEKAGFRTSNVSNIFD